MDIVTKQNIVSLNSWSKHKKNICFKAISLLVGFIFLMQQIVFASAVGSGQYYSYKSRFSLRSTSTEMKMPAFNARQYKQLQEVIHMQADRAELMGLLGGNSAEPVKADIGAKEEINVPLKKVGVAEKAEEQGATPETGVTAGTQGIQKTQEVVAPPAPSVKPEVTSHEMKITAEEKVAVPVPPIEPKVEKETKETEVTSGMIQSPHVEAVSAPPAPTTKSIDTTPIMSPVAMPISQPPASVLDTGISSKLTEPSSSSSGAVPSETPVLASPVPPVSREIAAEANKDANLQSSLSSSEMDEAMLSSLRASLDKAATPPANLEEPVPPSGASQPPQVEGSTLPPSPILSPLPIPSPISTPTPTPTPPPKPADGETTKPKEDTPPQVSTEPSKDVSTVQDASLGIAAWLKTELGKLVPDPANRHPVILERQAEIDKQFKGLNNLDAAGRAALRVVVVRQLGAVGIHRKAVTELLTATQTKRNAANNAEVEELDAKIKLMKERQAELNRLQGTLVVQLGRLPAAPK